MKRKKEKNLIDEFIESYDLLNEVIKNPTKIGYIGLLCKIEPKSRDLIIKKLSDFRNEIDKEIKFMINKIDKKIDF